MSEAKKVKRTTSNFRRLNIFKSRKDEVKEDNETLIPAQEPKVIGKRGRSRSVVQKRVLTQEEMDNMMRRVAIFR